VQQLVQNPALRVGRRTDPQQGGNGRRNVDETGIFGAGARLDARPEIRRGTRIARVLP
jgi:hypothetical protein